MKKNNRNSLRKFMRIMLFLGILAAIWLTLFKLPFSPGNIAILEPFNKTSANFVDLSQETISTSDYFKNNGAKSVVFISSTWCGSCGYFANEVAKTSEGFPGLKFYIVDIDKSRQLANELEIVLPKAIVFIDSEAIKIEKVLDLTTLNSKLNTFEEIGSFAL